MAALITGCVIAVIGLVALAVAFGKQYGKQSQREQYLRYEQAEQKKAQQRGAQVDGEVAQRRVTVREWLRAHRRAH